MRYFGIAAAGPYLQLCALEEVRTEEPPIRLHAAFYEPGAPAQVAAEIHAAEDAVVGVGAPLGAGGTPRVCDAELRRRGVFQLAPHDGARALVEAAGLVVYSPAPGSELTGAVEEGAYAAAPAFETHPDGVFCALRGLRLPAKRHPFGVQLRIEELADEHVEDDGGDLWHRRIEELEAAAAALAAHRYAVGHACWVGDPGEGVIVLPGSRLPDRFPGEGVIPPVVRRPLPGAQRP
jgi:predicted nuclease with RNAse H fold